MSADDKALIAAWAVVPFAELWFAWQGFVTPAAWQIALELVVFALVAVNHLHFAPPGFRRSVLWPAVVVLWMTLLALSPGDAASRAIYAVGLGVVVVGSLFAVHRWLFTPRWTGVLASLLAVVAARYAVLSWSGSARNAVTEPARVLLDELVPLPRSGTGGDGPRIALVTIDTLRWDHLVKMEAWRRLASRGRTWDRAMSTSSWTLPAMASLHTGLQPAEHGANVRVNGGYQPIVGTAPRLSVDLARAGYTTGAVFSNAWLLGGLGFQEGFHHYWHINRARPHRLAFAGVPLVAPYSGQAVTDRGLSVARKLPEHGGFLWVHYVDPHLPYAHAGGGLAAEVDQGRLRGGLILDDAGRAEVQAAYGREVELLDVQVTRLLDGLEAMGWLDDGWIILTSDHGEELFDHGSAEHGHSHHGEVVDVGLVIAGPGVTAGAGGGLASLVDVNATIRAIAGLARVGEGHDLRQPLPSDRIATAYGNAYVGLARSAREGTLRVIIEPDGAIHAYDLATDPTEHAPLDLPLDHPLVQAALAIEGPGSHAEADINAEALKALGYLE